MINRITLLGRLTKDPELHKTQSDVSVVSFTVAVPRPRVRDTTDFIECTAWRQAAEFLCEFGHKGSLVSVDGNLTQREFDNKDGVHVKTYNVLVENLSVFDTVSRKPMSDDGSTPPAASKPDRRSSSAKNAPEYTSYTGDVEDDLPF